MRATLLLADHAVVADGKLYINGGGWSVTGPGAPSAIAVKLDVPWDRANQRLHLRLRLIGQDGEPVTLPGPQGPQPIEITGDAEIGRPAGWCTAPTSTSRSRSRSARCRCEPGQRYQWVLDIDGETQQDWHLTFSTRTAPSRAGDVRRRALTGYWNLGDTSSNGGVDAGTPLPAWQNEQRGS